MHYKNNTFYFLLQVNFLALCSGTRNFEIITGTKTGTILYVGPGTDRDRVCTGTGYGPGPGTDRDRVQTGTGYGPGPGSDRGRVRTGTGYAPGPGPMAE